MTVSGKGARTKGLVFERTVLNHLHANQIDATNLNRSGFSGTDIFIDTKPPIMAEVKNQGKLNLAGWVDQANTDAGLLHAVVIHKRIRRADPDDAYVTMDLATFIHILHHIT